MPSLDGLLIVVAAGFAAPFLLGLAPALRIPAAALLAALVAVRGLPAPIYGLGRRDTLVAGLLQATSLPFLVATTAIGPELGLIGAGSRCCSSPPPGSRCSSPLDPRLLAPVGSAPRDTGHDRRGRPARAPARG